LITVITALALLSCDPGAERGNAGPALKTFKYAMDQTPTTLDPAQASNVYASFVIANAYDTLYTYQYLARPYQLKPKLAVDFPVVSPDGLTYTFKLKKGVRFVDDPCFPGGRGREVVAEDFIYSLKRHFARETPLR
jgi:ABC-type transport system substrate-binding protein